MSRKIISFMIAWSMIFLTFSVSAKQEISIYVSCKDGSDSNDGSKERPFKSIQKAQEQIRNIKLQNHDNSYITVYLSEGIYNLDNGLEFTSDDSGNEEYNIRYIGEGKGAKITCGIDIPYCKFRPLSANSQTARIREGVAEHILEVDINQMGINDFGTVSKRGVNSGTTNTSQVELFVGDEDIRLARWPNEGFALSGYCSPNTAYNEEKVYMECLEKRTKDWVDSEGNLKEKYGHIEAFTSYQYRTASAGLLGIEKDTGYMITDNPNDAEKDCNFGRDARYYVYNILEELDSPGEYYIDKDTGYLYLYPPEGFDENDQAVLSLKDADIIHATGLSHVIFENLIFSETRRNGINLDNCNHIYIKDCTIRNTGNYGLVINGGNNIYVTGSKVCNIAKNGLKISSADYSTLEKSNIVFDRGAIFNCSRTNATSVSAISFSGVGISVLNSEIYNVPHQAINFSGLKHTIRGNEIYNVCKNVSDAGAVYTGRSWSNRGNIIEKNYFHDIIGYYNAGVTAIYLDDYMSGVTVRENLFSDCASAVSVSGGRDNKILDNVVFNCKTSIGCSTHWGIDDDKWYAKEGPNSTNNDNLYYRLSRLDYLDKLCEEFPEVDYIYNVDEHPEYPKNNVIRGNIVYNSGDISASDLVVEYGDINITPTRHITIYK